MGPPSQSINAWIETNLFQDFATMPTQGNNTSAKQISGNKGEVKDKPTKGRVTRSMTNATEASNSSASTSSPGSTTSIETNKTTEQAMTQVNDPLAEYLEDVSSEPTSPLPDTISSEPLVQLFQTVPSEPLTRLLEGVSPEPLVQLLQAVSPEPLAHLLESVSSPSEIPKREPEITIKKESVEGETKPETIDDLEEQTAAAQVLQLLGLGRVEGESSSGATVKERESPDNTPSKGSSAIANNLEDEGHVSSPKTSSGREWTFEEDELLKTFVKKIGEGEWEQIANIISGRTSQECKRRWDANLALRESDSSQNVKVKKEQVSLIDGTLFGPDWPSSLGQNFPASDLQIEQVDQGSGAVDRQAGQQSQNIAVVDLVPEEAPQSHSDFATLGQWSGVVDPALLPIKIESQNQESGIIACVTQTSQSPSRKHSREEEENNLRDQKSETMQEEQEFDDSTQLLIKAMAQNPGLFYHSSGSYPHAPYTAGPEHFVISGTTGDLPLQPVQSKPSSAKIISSSDKNPRPVKRRKPSSLSEQGGGTIPISRRSTDATQVDPTNGYACTFPNCNKSFIRLYNLKSHQRTHTDERPYKCEHCSIAFSRNHDLKRHVKIHMNAKPFRCLGCTKLFSRLDAIKRHKANPKSRDACQETEVAEA